MRIRCSTGLRISAFFGHFFIRSTDLLALPACDTDKVCAVRAGGMGGRAEWAVPAPAPAQRPHVWLHSRQRGTRHPFPALS